MDEAPAAKKIVQYRLTPRTAEKRIKELAAETANLKWSRHALERMNEREIFDADVLRICRKGMLSGNPEETPAGEWKCKMVLRLRGTREAGAVVIILKQRGGLLIKTVEWEDLS